MGSADLCNGFGFVNKPRHRRTGDAAVEESKVTDEQTVDKSVEEKEVVNSVVEPEIILPETETTLPEPMDDIHLDPHVKVVIHSSPDCKYCPEIIKEAEKLKDEYEVVVEEHPTGFRTAYGYYISTFPYVEYCYDGKVKLYSYGYKTEAQLRKIINSLK